MGSDGGFGAGGLLFAFAVGAAAGAAASLLSQERSGPENRERLRRLAAAAGRAWDAGRVAFVEHMDAPPRPASPDRETTAQGG